MNRSSTIAINAGMYRTRPSDWVLAHFTRPTRMSRHAATTIIVCLLLFVGLADYATGIKVSLALFYLVPILFALAWFGTAPAIAVLLASLLLRIVGDLASNDGEPLPFWNWWNAFSTLGVFLFIVWVFGNLLELTRLLELRVVERTDELMNAVDHRRQLEGELLTISANERNSMGQELHDDICQHLVATAFAAKVLTQRLSQEGHPRSQEGQAIVALIEEAANKTRRLARGLLLSTIRSDELADKLAELAAEATHDGLQCQFIQHGAPSAPEGDASTQIYRIAQEAMRNAVRHGEARRIDLSLVGHVDAICLTVEDDGIGIGDQSKFGMGLPIMRQRATYIGATLSVVPAAGAGTKVICHLPIARESGS